ncbi:MAG TPA: restriction endonuclease subunit S [Steroidobacteraceae bacterium]|jgi:type I restriction enzyme S subunit|nr:restriction endonuclease subunit S [Steroidobacteraceae bacterium]HNS26764.1 restriction endonuclease subunit S [Steroidobacteraceae bacterium]
MADDWRKASIGALCDAGDAELQTGPFGTQLHAYDYVDDGVPVVPTEAIRARQIDHSVLPKITQTKAKELERHRLRPGDILFARRGVQAAGHIGCVRKAEDGFICGTGAIRLRVARDSDAIDPAYLSHVLADPSSVQWFKFHAIGATMPNLNEGIIRSFPLSVPPLSEQRAIAHILGTLDDKIELNRRMGETLEAMARALFKSWFVDYHPVRAKAEGRDTGLPKPLADLFPARLVDSDVGEIPDGWEVARLTSAVEVNPPRSLRKGVSLVAQA